MISNYKFALPLLLFTLLAFMGFAQTIKGTVKDTTGKGIPYASINLKGPGNAIIAYTVSGTNGQFTLNLPANASKDGLKVEVSCIGFNKQAKELTDFTAPCNFTLAMAVNQLQGVIIKN